MSIGGNGKQAEDSIAVQLTCQIDSVGEGGGLVGDFLGLTGSRKLQRRQGRTSHLDMALIG